MPPTDDGGPLSPKEVALIKKWIDDGARFGAGCLYLADLGELPARPLIATVPVSIRDESDGNRGNALSMALANLATGSSLP